MSRRVEAALLVGFFAAHAAEAVLRNANLKGAVLVEANLKGATLEGAKLEDAKFCKTTMPDGAVNNSGC